MRTIDITPLDRPSERPVSRSSNTIAFIALAGLFSFVSWRVVGAGSGARSEPFTAASAFSAPPSGASAAEPSVVPTQRNDLTEAERETIEIFRRASPAVVHVTNVAKVITRRSYEDIVRGAGSGFVWDAGGHIVTNFHVVAGSDAVYVRFAGDPESYNARIVNTAPHHDIAVLKLTERPDDPLTPIEIGRSSDLLVGQHVYAIGNPFGLDQTLSSGLISGLGREIRSLTDHKIGDVIQTDAAINPGNSGGPLLDSRGRLIGVNTAIVTLSGAYNGIGFATPVDTVKRVVDEIVTTGRVTRPGLGVILMQDPEAQRYGLAGVGIESVRDGSAAEQAGLRSASLSARRELTVDEILAIDGVEVKSVRDVYDALDGRAVGDRITLRVRRNGRVFDAPLRLQALRD